MSKISLAKPVLILLYGYPGAGKTYFARQFCETVNASHIFGDRIRSELFEEPRYDKQEDEIVSHLMYYMAEQFLQAGVSVVFDANAARLSQRRLLREMARKAKAEHILVWFQTDQENAFNRLINRDKRKRDDKFARDTSRTLFQEQVANMQNPVNEDYIVLSGKHAFISQYRSVLRKLHEQKLVDSDTARNSLVKPGLINLVHSYKTGRVDESRRNVVIR